MTAQEGSGDLAVQVLQVAARAGKPIGPFDIAMAIDPNPDPSSGVREGTPEFEAFVERRIAIVGAVVEAEEAGFLELAGRDDENGTLVRISARGREQLRG